ncbi:hypothetical protein [Variovorax sp. Sphag1AA]|uniref:hypothetical protein n=1 Tax=Variovorax sp. Sphag1AA TaxID=2587027 RepID=UPI00161CE693|nr:hypothetical protein [Variovorax sp. Sphag1AA]MBB3180097.1 hypothetical protein [Variovorax sp. Sphag1AA]
MIGGPEALRRTHYPLREVAEHFKVAPADLLALALRETTPGGLILCNLHGAAGPTVAISTWPADDWFPPKIDDLAGMPRSLPVGLAFIDDGALRRVMDGRRALIEQVGGFEARKLVAIRFEPAIEIGLDDLVILADGIDRLAAMLGTRPEPEPPIDPQPPRPTKGGKRPLPESDADDIEAELVRMFGSIARVPLPPKPGTRYELRKTLADPYPGKSRFTRAWSALCKRHPRLAQK